eukprot:1158139-Pelagomonas_calceolata.AAC.16
MDRMSMKLQSKLDDLVSRQSSLRGSQWYGGHLELRPLKDGERCCGAAAWRPLKLIPGTGDSTVFDLCHHHVTEPWSSARRATSRRRSPD